MKVWEGHSNILHVSHKAQAGFRPEYSTVAYMFSLSNVIKLKLHGNEKIYPLFVRFVGVMKDDKYFAKLNANSGFWQIALTDYSTKLATFITPF